MRGFQNDITLKLISILLCRINLNIKQYILSNSFVKSKILTVNFKLLLQIGSEIAVVSFKKLTKKLIQRYHIQNFNFLQF